MIDFAWLVPEEEIKPIYLTEAPLLDVLMEQLEFLVEHDCGCVPGCPDCRRLAQVQRSLLKPFWEKRPGKVLAA